MHLLLVSQGDFPEIALPDSHSSNSNNIPCGHDRGIPVATLSQLRVQFRKAEDNSLVNGVVSMTETKTDNSYS